MIITLSTSCSNKMPGKKIKGRKVSFGSRFHRLWFTAAWLPPLGCSEVGHSARKSVVKHSRLTVAARQHKGRGLGQGIPARGLPQDTLPLAISFLTITSQVMKPSMGQSVNEARVLMSLSFPRGLASVHCSTRMKPSNAGASGRLVQI